MQRPAPARRLPAPGRLAIGIVALALGTGFSAALLSSDRMVAHGFNAALQQSVAASEVAPRGGKQVVGTEDFWLSQKGEAAGGLQRAAWKGGSAPLALKIGDRVTVSGADGTRTLEVVALDSAAAETRIETAAAPLTEAVVVTCRDVAAPDAPLVRFSTVPSDQTPSTAKARSL